MRIEDIDTTRCTPVLTEALREDLQWLGLWPVEPVLQQSQHMGAYADVLDHLRQRRLVYPCFCTRSDIAAAASGQQAPDGSAVYPGTCRAGVSDKGRAPAWRLDMQRALNEIHGVPSWYEAGRGRVVGRADEFGDIVLGRRDTGVSYHLCVTHDDALQGITCVTRGQDLYAATSIQRVLQALMKWPEPEYSHHALILDKSGKKLSKRDGAEGVRTLRAMGWSVKDVLTHPLVVKALAAS